MRKVYFIIAAVIISALLVCNMCYVRSNSIEVILGYWTSKPFERYKIVDKLLERLEIIGMSKSEIEALLGESSGRYSFKIGNKTYSPDDIVSYFIGNDLIDSMWMIIVFENDIAVSIEKNIS